MNTRVARIEDAPAVAALVTQLGYEAPGDEVAARLARVVARRDQQFIVAEADGRLLGAWARQQGCSVMRLWSSTTRTPAHRFYAGLGYDPVKTQYSFVKALDPGGGAIAGRLVPRVESET